MHTPFEMRVTQALRYRYASGTARLRNRYGSATQALRHSYGSEPHMCYGAATKTYDNATQVLRCRYGIATTKRTSRECYAYYSQIELEPAVKRALKQIICS